MDKRKEKMYIKGRREKDEWKQTRLMMLGAIPSLLRASSYCGTYLNRNRKPFIVVSKATGNKGWKNIKGNREEERERERERQKERKTTKRRKKDRNFSFIMGRAKTKRTHHCSGTNYRWTMRTEYLAWHVRVHCPSTCRHKYVLWVGSFCWILLNWF